MALRAFPELLSALVCLAFLLLQGAVCGNDTDRAAVNSAQVETTQETTHAKTTQALFLENGRNSTGSAKLPKALMENEEVEKGRWQPAVDGSHVGTVKAETEDGSVGVATAGIEASCRKAIPGCARCLSKSKCKACKRGFNRTDRKTKCEPPPIPAGCASIKFTRRVVVSTSGQLQAALDGAQPGDMITPMPGTYPGLFSAKGKAGYEQWPIVLCADPGAVVLQGPSMTDPPDGIVLYMLDCYYWQVIGLTLRTAMLGLYTDGSQRNLFKNVEVFETGQEGVHLRFGSSNNTLSGLYVHDTGKVRPQYGEGLYIGSSINNFPNDYTNFNKVIKCRFGPGVAAEGIDIKEFTRGGVIEGNKFDGTGMQGQNYADSWIAVKGSDYRVTKNQGVNSIWSGIQVVPITNAPQSGQNNYFAKNKATCNSGGYTVEDWGSGNIIRCNNKAKNCQLGVTNVACK